MPRGNQGWSTLGEIGAGRPKLKERRKPRNIAAYDDEFVQLKHFAKQVRSHPDITAEALKWIDYQIAMLHNEGEPTKSKEQTEERIDEDGRTEESYAQETDTRGKRTEAAGAACKEKGRTRSREGKKELSR